MIRLNDFPIKPTLFPDNTSQVWKVDEVHITKHNVIEWDFTHEGEIMHVAQLRDLIRVHTPIARVELFMPYLPYARQDKMISNETSFALNTFALLINRMIFDRVSCIDAHSDRASRLIHSFNDIKPTEFINKVMKEVEPDQLCYPDAGARNRYSQFIDWPYIYCQKVRDQLTGEIKDLEVIGEPRGRVLIVDDICDGGRTFTTAARKLLAKGAKEVHLYTTHGIYSRGIDFLKDSGIESIYCHKGEVSEHQSTTCYRRL